MGVDRLERVNSLLKRVIAEGMFQVMQGDSVSPGLFTVTNVHCGKDLRDATVSVSAALFHMDITKSLKACAEALPSNSIR